LHALKLTFYRGQFVAAVYSGSRRSAGEAEEKLRKMLVEKYGQPAWMIADRFGKPEKRALAKDFTDRHVGEGKYGWDFAGGMQLVFKKTFFGDMDLSYVDPARFDELKRLATAADAADTRVETRKKSHAF
jgi:hypothetical protein